MDFDTEYVERRLADLLDERCDCVFSIRASTMCSRCREIEFLRKLLGAANEPPAERFKA